MIILDCANTVTLLCSSTGVPAGGAWPLTLALPGAPPPTTGTSPAPCSTLPASATVKPTTFGTGTFLACIVSVTTEPGLTTAPAGGAWLTTVAPGGLGPDTCAPRPAAARSALAWGKVCPSTLGTLPG